MMQAEQDALITQLQGQIQALEDAAAAAAVLPPGGAPPATPVFTLAPALANKSAYLDLTSTSGAKHFKGATEALIAQTFDFADPSDLQVFLDLVLKKSQVYGWNHVLTIPVTDNVVNVTTDHNLLSEYGLIPLTSVRDHVSTYYGTKTKQAQDSFMFCQSLLNSLSVEFLKLITADSCDYHMPAIVAVDGPIPAGPLLLKIIISKAHVDSRATVTHIRTTLTKLDDKMIELDSDIEAFNFFVKAKVKDLAARGESSSDLLINLFSGYKVANDAEFQDFIRRKENAYEEGKDITTANLMEDSAAKYRTRKMTGKWSAPTKEQEQILALTAQIEKFQASSPKPKNKGKNSKVKPSSDKSNSKAKQPSIWAWKDVMPKEGEPVTKHFQGKDYHVGCKFHEKKWVCHTTEQCSKNPANATAASAASVSPAPATSAAKKPSRRLRQAQLAAALLEEEEEDDDESLGGNN
jgi:hypothetical protein